MKVLLGVSGSIAAYKALLLTRLLVKQNHEVKVIMTQGAVDFVQPLSFSTLSKNKVVTSFYNSEGTLWNNHVELGLWADIFVVAPATANTIAKMTNGISDNLLVATYLSARCKTYLAPAMDLDMWQHSSTLRNIEQLKNDGVTIIDVGDGELASGLSGKGRMAEPEIIVEQIFKNETTTHKPLAGKKLLVSAGPTYEAIDPVRFIGNHSSGKMGIAIAEKAAEMGAEVTLVLGPSNLSASNTNINTKKVVSTQNMFETIISISAKQDVIIMAAAVSDYTPLNPANEKIKKKDGDDFSIALKRTPDILLHLGKHKNPKQTLVGFALETQNGLENAKKKLAKKNLDLIVLNSLKDENAGFKHNTNKVTFVDKHQQIEACELKPKTEVAVDILNKIINLTNE